MKKITLTLHLTIHEDGSRFSEWELRGIEKDEAMGVLRQLAEDLQNGPLIVLKSERGPAKEEL